MSEYNPQRLESSLNPSMNLTGTAPNHMNLTGTAQQPMNPTGTRHQAINQQSIPIQRAESTIGPAIPPPTGQRQMGLMSGFWNDSENRIWSVVDKAALKANESEINEQRLKAFEIVSVILYLTVGIVFTYTSLIQDPKQCSVLRSWGRNFGIYCLIMSILKGMSFVSLSHFTNENEKQQIAFFLKVVSYIEIGVLCYFTLALTVAIISPFDKNCYSLDTIVLSFLILSMLRQWSS